MAKLKTNVYDSKNKKNLTGYIENGKTYLDDGSRITAGMESTDSSGRVWRMGEDGKGVDFTPVPKPQPTGGLPKDDTSAYSDIEKAYLAKQKAMQDGLNTQLGQIDQASDDNRSKVYTNSRLSAIGNNEQLASRGLAGGLYGDPTSGKSESSRISQDVALGNDINAINRQQTDLESQARNIVSSGIADNQLEMAKVIAEMKASKTTADRADFDNTIGAYSGDYQAQINKLKAQGYSDDSYEVKSLNSARNNKKAGIASSQAEAEQQAFENQIKLMNATKSSGSGSSTTVKSLMTSTDIKGVISDSTTSTALKDAKKQLDNGDISQVEYNKKVKAIESESKMYALKQINTQYANGGLNETDYAKYVSLHYGSDSQAKVDQMVQGLGTYMLNGGSKEAVLKQIENAFFSGGLTKAEANAILQQFGIAGI